MQERFFLTIKALSVLSSDIVKIIWGYIEEYYKDKISNILSKLYFNKVKKNCKIYLLMLRYVYNEFIDDNEIKSFLCYFQKNITYNYIQCTDVWISNLFLIRNKFSDNYISENIDKICLNVLLTLVHSK